MDLFEISVWINVIALSIVGCFQLALVLGAPWGEFAFGGRTPGKLPKNLRIASAFSIALYLGIAGHYLAQVGILPKLLPQQLNSMGNWVIVGLNGLSLIMNTISRSAKERAAWAPVALVLLATSWVVALG